MNRIEEKLRHLNGKKALAVFLTAGDGGLETTKRLILEAERCGADIIELGLPFSDPVAESPSLKKASLRAINNGISTEDIFAFLRSLRKETQIPVVLSAYTNSIYRFGTERFFSLCALSGADAVAAADLPFEEKDEIEPFAKKHNIFHIGFVSPFDISRAKRIAQRAQGLLICCGFAEQELEAFAAQLTVPCFAVCNGGDGIILSDAVADILEKHGENSVAPVGELVARLKKEI